jgi:hypothetical protein
MNLTGSKMTGIMWIDDERMFMIGGENDVEVKYAISY